MINILKNNWSKKVSISLSSEKHILILSKLWEGKQPLNKLGVNYKTASRIISQLVKEGLVATEVRGRKKHHQLTDTGRVISAFALGKFADVTRKIEINPIIDKEEFVIEREETVQEILYNIERKRHVLILADSGYGKTTLLKLLKKKYLPEAIYVESKTAKHIVEAVSENLNISLKTLRGRRKRIVELLNDIDEYMSRNKNIQKVLLVDEVEDCSKQVSRIIKRLQRAGFTIVGAGTNNKRGLEFQKEIRLRPLTNEESIQLVKNILSQEFQEPPSDIVNLIKNKSGNIPERIKQNSDDTIISSKKGDFKIENKKSKHSYVSTLKNHSRKRVNLISPSSLVAFAFLLLAIRYMLYGTKNYQLGYAFAMVAYIIFFLFRWKRK